MDVEEFRSEFLSQVGVWATADSNFSHSAFVDVAIHYLEEAGEVSDFEPCYYRGTSRRRNIGVDGYAFDKADASARLFLADPCSNGGATLTQTEAKAQFGKLRAFAEEAMDGRLEEVIDDNSPARALADELREKKPNISSIRAYLLTDAVLSTRVKDWPEGEVAGIPIEFHIWDITRFHRAHTSLSGQDDLVIDFAGMSCRGLPCLEASTEGSPYLSYLCILPGPVLADVYDAYGSRLLEGNVRAFLSTKGRINKGIRNTVLHQPEMFFAYNNGIAATASSADVVKTLEGLRLMSVTDLQIVNGGQTTASLSFARRTDKAALERTFVPMKLSVIDAERSAEMIPQISRFANSQNKVSDADFFANHPYHRRVELISRRVWAPAKKGAQHETRWFYERARGQYINETASMGAADRRRFIEMNPRDQVVTKTDLAKSENSWLQLPQRVSRGAQSNFLEFANRITAEWSDDKDSFHEEYFRLVMARIILFRETERIVSKQVWYKGGYRANIVTYTISKLAHDIKTSGRLELDLRSIWQRQGISAALSEQIALTAEVVYSVITAPPPGHENVTQWCKKDLCWLNVKDAANSLLTELIAELVPPEEARDEARGARAQQKLDSGIGAQAAVVGLGIEYWRELLSWGTARSLVTPEDGRIVGMAAGFGASIPSDRQSKRLLVLKERLEQEGFAPVPLAPVPGS